MPAEHQLNYVRYAREVARLSWEPLKDREIRKTADELERAIKQFELQGSIEAMQRLNGAFVRTIWAVDQIRPQGGDNPNGGRMEVLKQEAA